VKITNQNPGTFYPEGIRRFLGSGRGRTSVFSILLAGTAILHQTVALANNVNATGNQNNCFAACDNPNGRDALSNVEQIVINVAGLSLTLNLTPNFVASHSTFAINGVAQARSSRNIPQTYKGSVSGDPDSWVRVIKNQDGHFLGQLQAFGELYEVSPSADKTKTTAHTLPPMQEQLRSITGGALTGNLVDNLVNPPIPKLIANETQRNAINNLRDSFGVDVPKAMRIGIVVDSRFNDFHRGAGLNRAVALINVIDGIYQSELGAALILDTVIAYTDPATDPMLNATGSVEEILESFRTVREFEPELRDDLTMVHLFTGARDPAGVLGLGWINTACRTDGFDISLSTPFAYDALLAAHEMAHNLGALHDDAPACSTGRSNIMIDLSIELQSQQQSNNADTSRTLSALVRNNDPARNAVAVNSNFFLPFGSTVTSLPGNCNESVDIASASPLVTCTLGDIAPQAVQQVQLEMRLDTSPRDQWAQVRVGSLLAADTTISNNQSQLNLANSAATASGGPNTAQNDAAGAATQLVLPDGSNVPLDQSTINLASSETNSSGVSTGGSGTLSLFGLFLLLGNIGFYGLRRVCRTTRYREATRQTR